MQLGFGTLSADASVPKKSCATEVDWIHGAKTSHDHSNTTGPRNM